MARGNTLTSYGSVTKSFHWLTAFLILSMIPLGFFANQLAYQIKDPSIPSTGEDIARVAWLFSLHKTVGVALFFTALARISWAISQPKPKLLNGDKTLEAWAASTVHWVLYSALVIVPLSGWIHHAATTGFAPIWWPFGQSLPFVPKDALLAEQTATLHWLSCLILVGALVLHIGGALKHHVIDKDATLRRMLPGRVSAQPSSRQPGEVFPVFAALSVWVAVIFVGGSLTLAEDAVEITRETTTEEIVVAEAPVAAPTDTQWTVTEGELSLTVQQFGSAVEGRFEDWTASISYSETPDETGAYGQVTVTVNIASLSLGSVTDQAKGAEYFDVTTFPTAVFQADIVGSVGNHIAEGRLTVKDQTVSLTMPFDLALEGDTATAKGGLTLDRRDFSIGMGTTDEATLAFGVDVSFDLTAQRGDQTEDTLSTVADSTATALPAEDGAWSVTDGTLALSVDQFGSAVAGEFADWTAEILYDETPDSDGKHGRVEVVIDIASLSLGSVTDQAKGPDYFDLNTHPKATFEADIMARDEGHVAVGTLTIKDQSVSVEMPFALSVDGNTAQAEGTLGLDRRDFLIGMGTTDAATLGFDVAVRFSLTAERSGTVERPVGSAAQDDAQRDASNDVWSVERGALNIAVNQFGSAVTGAFNDWSAQIRYSDEPDETGKLGDVTVNIDIASLTLGSVTDQAKGPDYFDAATHPSAVFTGDIFATETGHVARGTLTIKGQAVETEMSFALAIDGDTAEASGTLVVDRRDFLIGMGTTDEATLAFGVEVSFEVLAGRERTITATQN